MSKQRKKDAKQQEQRTKRRAARKAQKAKREANATETRDTTFIIEETPTILIVCEGKNTEPNYFSYYKALVPSIQLEIKGAGKGHQALVTSTKRTSQHKNYDQIWCVFDREDPSAVSVQQFDHAVFAALKNGFMVAYSNQAFEYWFYLHFFDHQGGQMDRKVCCEKFSDWIARQGYIYDCKQSKSLSKDLFDFMRSIDPNHPSQLTFQQQALQRAQKIHQDHLNGILGTNPSSPATHESSTTVYQLVEILNQYTF